VKRRLKLIALVGLLTVLGGVSALQHRTAYSSPDVCIRDVCIRDVRIRDVADADEFTEVAIVRANSWPVSDGEVEALVRQAVGYAAYGNAVGYAVYGGAVGYAVYGGAVAAAGGLEHIVQPGDTVVLKPNLVWGADPDEGHTTDPRVTRALVQLAREAGAGQVLIADGAARYRDGHDARGATIDAFRLCGYDADGNRVDDATGAPLIDLNNAGGLDQQNPDLVRRKLLQHGLMWTEYWLPTIVLDADVLIGVPVLKNHLYAGTSLALKNQIGIAPSDIYHEPGLQVFKGALSHGPNDLGRHIVDLNLARPLDFAVVDGLRGLTDGPIGETVADPPMRLILAGQDAVAVDTVGTLVMGYDPTTIPYLNWADEAGLGTSNPAQITVRGRRVSQVRRDFPAPYGNPPAQRAEATPPSVSITAPREDDTVLENTLVWAAASDNDAISKVEFYANEELQATVTAPPYKATLDLSANQGQTATVRAVAYDFALNDAEDHRTVNVVGTPTPHAASLQTATLTIPTYPYTSYLTSAYTPTYNITYTVLNWNEYNNSSLTPIPQNYELLVLENDYLRVTLLPELGGRIYQMVFKPTNHNELYQNPVIKPTHWGPPEQGWWLAAGGIEWCLPVEEHGYEWGEPWDYQTVSSTAGITVTLRDTTASDRLRAAVTVHLPTHRGVLMITPRIENPTDQDIAYKYWTNAMLAPGEANAAGPDLHFVFNAEQMTVHSTGNSELPEPGLPMDWPVHNGRDYSRLGNWDRWIGFFERPYATTGFAGVYDTGAAEGIVRIFPPEIARGSKGFGFGWSDPIPSDTWTDDGSSYVELHGGIAPTFWDTAIISAGQPLEWTEQWYPLHEIGQPGAATAEAALGIRERDGSFIIGVHSTAPRAAGASVLYAWDRSDCTELGRWELPPIGPDDPFLTRVPTGGRTSDDVTLAYLSAQGEPLATVNLQDCLPPTSSIEPLPPWVETTAFSVAWEGHDPWSEIAAYDVQVRDGYEGTWTDWLTDTTITSGTFTGMHGHTYFFRSRARDSCGNQGIYGDEEWGQAFTTVLTGSAPVLVTSRKSAIPMRPPPDQAVTYTILISNTGNLTASATLTDTPTTTMVVLTKTLTCTAGLTPTYEGGQIRWSGTVETNTEVRVTYALSPTDTTPIGVPLTNTVEIAGSVLGPFTRQAAIRRLHFVRLPLLMRTWEP
jgi:uncharacterized repeat protein (TIGR01451 family)